MIWIAQVWYVKRALFNDKYREMQNTLYWNCCLWNKRFVLMQKWQFFIPDALHVYFFRFLICCCCLQHIQLQSVNLDALTSITTNERQWTRRSDYALCMRCNSAAANHSQQTHRISFVPSRAVFCARLLTSCWLRLGSSCVCETRALMRTFLFS